MGRAMKRIIVLYLAIAPMGAIAAGPSTSCPAGYTAVVTDYITIADDACPSGHTSIGTATSCLASNPGGSCIMYAPANTTYSDNTGSYVFEQACAME